MPFYRITGHLNRNDWWTRRLFRGYTPLSIQHPEKDGKAAPRSDNLRAGRALRRNNYADPTANKIDKMETSGPADLTTHGVTTICGDDPIANSLLMLEMLKQAMDQEAFSHYYAILPDSKKPIYDFLRDREDVTIQKALNADFMDAISVKVYKGLKTGNQTPVLIILSDCWKDMVNYNVPNLTLLSEPELCRASTIVVVSDAAHILGHTTRIVRPGSRAA
jgi:hypothetical protein